MSLIDTYHIATMGQNSVDTFTLATNGVLVYILIEPEPTITPTVTQTPTSTPSLSPTPTSTVIGDDKPILGGFLGTGLGKSVRKASKNKKKELSLVDDGKCVDQKITVIAIIDKKEYKESIVVSCKPNITVDDINVIITENNNKPKIKILLKD